MIEFKEDLAMFEFMLNERVRIIFNNKNAIRIFLNGQ